MSHERQEACVKKISPDLGREKKSRVSVAGLQVYATCDIFWLLGRLCLTFAGFRAAKTVKQLTQEAMTSTGGEITVVNLVGEQHTVLSKMNKMTVPSQIFSSPLSPGPSWQQGMKTGNPSAVDRHHTRASHCGLCAASDPVGRDQILTFAAACRCET